MTKQLQSKVYTQENWKCMFIQNVYINVHGSFIYNNPKVEKNPTVHQLMNE